MNNLIVKNVDLLGSSVLAAKDNDGIIWVGVRWMCEAMGMSEGQYKRQIKNIQKDMLLKASGSNLLLNKGTGEREVFCIKNDYIPMWLAKITITEKTRQENPELADKLLDYQLKAKDILAEAFMQKKNTMPVTTDDKIMLLAQGHVELKEEVDSIKADLEALKMDLPILPIEADKITEAVKKKGVEILGGKESRAYKNNSLRQKVYNSIYANLKYNFSVRSYKAIKRSQCDRAVEVVNNFIPPYAIEQAIISENSQLEFDI